ncbi:MAG: cadmium-translocating P-type ATPase [Candidatus Pacebacteria bacterium]|nr:cadmium-translocating P-type ATPase [Candidatus Paceibacterota bacterium]
MAMLKLLFAREHWVELSSILIVGLAVLLFSTSFLPLPALIASILLGLSLIAKEALEEFFRHKKVGTELFITVAVAVALFGGEYLAGAVVLMIILIAEYIASVSGERARDSIRELIGTVPKVATIKRNGQHEVVDLALIQIGDIVLVKAGDKIPVDGEVVGGDGAVDQSPITGESMPQEKFIGDEVFAGTILETGALDIKVTKLIEDTVFARIITLVEEAESREPVIQKFTDTVAAWLIPIVFVFVLVVYFYTHDIKLIIALLIFMSPAELGLATPLVTISAIARAAKEGILVKGGLYLEALARADTFVFDKTGTLTLGKLQVDEVSVDDPNISEAELITLAAAADQRSGHPLARAIVEFAESKGVPRVDVESFEVIKGRGVRAVVNGKVVLIGNQALFVHNGISVLDSEHTDETDTVVYLSVDGVAKGHFHVTSTVRPGAREAIEALRASGVTRILMLTGDHGEAARKIADELSITEVRADLLPQDKIKIVDELQKEGRLVVMVGDGINDAPALAAASVGVAMGAVGTQSAMEAADIVLVNDDLHKLTQARAISRRAYRTIKENIFVGVGVVHVIGIILVLTKVIGPVEAAIIHLVPDTLVFLNSTKLLRVKL